ncbi:SusC/RagA family TonB-linked outer membrane protein [Foetidibacter luteolus]|uniref:SusC/RagA family TonB-linked outer membrane protein n=1 Tax=Foetidibacter luteolus TaxID=2608880 RepID=UPI001A99398B|nr:TonB-dependent receptor [Foetidibacter luteolus]
MKKKKGLLLMLSLLFACAMYAQKTVTGTVSDSTGAKLQGVSIYVAGTSTGTASGLDGTFSLSVPSGATRLEFSLVGFQTKTVDISSGTSFDVTLSAAAGALTDVVVVGYGTQRKRDVTGTISSVKGDDFKNLPVSNAAQALQGRAAGVNIVRSDGSPGSVPTIRIRGTGTINSADPLVVIDGVPAGSLNDVNPNDIASIEVLKDASSSAIYGTRAANGVVLVTTKKGNFGEQLKVSLNGYTGSSKAIKYLDVLTAPDLATLKKEAFTNDGLLVSGIWNDPNYATQRTDWQRALIGTGKTKNVDFAVRGGNEKSTYSFSGNYYDEKGMIVNTYFKRYSARINSEHKFLKIFKLGENFLYSTTNGNSTDTRSTQTGTVWSALRFNPAIPVYNEDGSWGTSKADNELGDINNPVFTAASPDVRNRTNNLLTNAYLQVDIVKGLSVKANIGYSSSTFRGYTFNPAEPNQTRSIPLASLSQGQNESSSLLEEYTLTYSNVFAKSHSVNFTGGYSAQNFEGSYFNAWRNGYDDPSDPLRNLNNGNPAYQFNNGSRNIKSGLASYFGRLNYGYKNRYLLTVTMRADGSSKFPKNKQWGYFPAFSAGWRISDEDFFKNSVSFINELKLSGGWGQLGNQAVPDLQYLAILGTGLNYNFGNSPAQGAGVISLSNPAITWERAEMTNISLEFALLQNRLTGTLTWFNKNTKDMLIPYSIVETYGIAGIPNQNIGTLNNKGIEAELNYQNRVGEFTYSIGANASFIKNKVTLLYGDEKNYIGSAIYGRQLLETSRTYEGQPISSFYGFKTNGLYQNQKEIDDDANIANDGNKANIKPGDVRFVDQNGDGVINDQDRVYLGNPNPKVVYGINGSAGFKHFDLSFSFAGVSGVSLYNADRVAGLDATGVFNWYEEQLNRWHGEGTSNTVPRLTRRNPNNNYRSSDMWIEDGSYLALKNITLGYTFSNLKVSGFQLPQARIYVSCFNAFYLTGYNGFTPELGYTDGNRQRGVDVAQYPSARTFTVGASLNF